MSYLKGNCPEETTWIYLQTRGQRNRSLSSLTSNVCDVFKTVIFSFLSANSPVISFTFDAFSRAVTRNNFTESIEEFHIIISWGCRKEEEKASFFPWFQAESKTMDNMWWLHQNRGNLCARQLTIRSSKLGLSSQMFSLLAGRKSSLETNWHSQIYEP